MIKRCWMVVCFVSGLSACGNPADEAMSEVLSEGAETGFSEDSVDPGSSQGGERPGDANSDSVDEDSSVREQHVLFIGDSILDWNREEDGSVADFTARTAEIAVVDLAVGGALFSDGDEGIPGQYVSGDWDWVVFDWGGNDVNDRCGCGACLDVMNELLSADAGSGLVADFVRYLRSRNHQVLILGYYEMPETAAYGFDRCNDELALFRERNLSLAGQDSGIRFLDLSTLISPSALEYYDEDHVHPSVSGSRRIGEAIAEEVLASSVP